MAIEFKAYPERGYFLARYKGPITEEEIITAHEEFFKAEEWNPTLNALVDLSEVEFVENSNQAVRRVALFFHEVLTHAQARNLKTAIFANKDFTFGLARVYEAMTAFSPHTVQVFRSLKDAEDWLLEKDNGMGS